MSFLSDPARASASYIFFNVSVSLYKSLAPQHWFHCNKYLSMYVFSYLVMSYWSDTDVRGREVSTQLK